MGWDGSGLETRDRETRAEQEKESRRVLLQRHITPYTYTIHRQQQEQQQEEGEQKQEQEEQQQQEPRG